MYSQLLHSQNEVGGSIASAVLTVVNCKTLQAEGTCPASQSVTDLHSLGAS